MQEARSLSMLRRTSGKQNIGDAFEYHRAITLVANAADVLYWSGSMVLLSVVLAVVDCCCRRFSLSLLMLPSLKPPIFTIVKARRFTHTTAEQGSSNDLDVRFYQMTQTLCVFPRTSFILTVLSSTTLIRGKGDLGWLSLAARLQLELYVV